MLEGLWWGAFGSSSLAIVLGTVRRDPGARRSRSHLLEGSGNCVGVVTTLGFATAFASSAFE